MRHWFRSKRFLAVIAATVGLLTILPYAVFSNVTVTPVSIEAEQAEVAGQIQVETATMGKPEVVSLQFLDQPPALDPETQARLAKAVERTHLPGPPLPISPQAVEGPQKGTETNLIEASTAVPGTFTALRNVAVPVPSGWRSSTNEPSLANIGRYVFYTGNWYAMRSTDGGAAWSFVSPIADMSDFCCDQEVIKDPGRQIIMWYRQGVYQGAPNNSNRFRLGVSSNGGTSFCFYNVRPNNVNAAWTSQWFDYPHLAISNDFLYIATNMYTPAGSWIRTVMLRFPLDALAACTGFSYLYLPWTANFNFTPVQGATDTMYWASHQSTSVLRIFRWPEGAAPSAVDKSVPAWTSTPRGSATCTTPDGRNPCAFLDHRINAGWYTNRDGVAEVGWFWTVKQGAGFPYPYINAARFRVSDVAYLGRPFIWNSSFAWFYAAISPNKRGHLGLATYLAGGGYHIRLLATIDDDFNVVPPPWEPLTVLRTSTHGPASNRWGDYLRVRPHDPEEIGWILGGHTLQGGGANNNAEARYVVFTRERDRQSVWWWWNQP